MKLSLKIISVFIVVLTIVVVVSGSIFILVAQNALKKRTEAQLNSVMILKKNQLNRFIEKGISDVESMTKDITFLTLISEASLQSGEDPYKKVRTWLQSKRDEKDDFLEFFILDDAGTIIVSTERDQEGKIKSHENYFEEGLSQTFLQSFYYNVALQEPAMTIASPISVISKEITGVFAANVNLEEISEIMEERTGLGESGETYLVNSFNFLVSKSRFIEGIEFKKTIHTEGVRDCLKGKTGLGYYPDYRDVPTVGAYTWLPEQKVCLLAKMSAEEAFRPTRQLVFVVLMTASGMIVLSGLLGVFFSRVVTRPLLALRDAAEKIGKGERTHAIPITSKDEIGELAATFNLMASKLRTSHDSLRTKNEELENLTTSLEGRVEERTAELETAKAGLEEEVEKRTKELSKKVEELEKFQKVAVGRELKMMEMKKTIKQLKDIHHDE